MGLFMHIYVKLVNSTKMAMYEMSKYITLNDLLFHLANILPRDFEMTEYELVDARHLETGPILIHSNQTLATLYPGKREIAFYIRPPLPQRTPRAPRLSLANIFQMVRVVPSRRRGECMICHESEYITQPYGCRHSFCNECIRGCERANIDRCAVCRRQQVGQQVGQQVDTRERIEPLVIPHSI